MQEKALKWLYESRCNTPSDINEHLPTLKRYASKCNHVTEMWVREWLSSVALMLGCNNLVSYDIQLSEGIKNIKEIQPDRDFRLGDTLEIYIEDTDMLFIDTWHCYDQLIAELNRHAYKVKRYIVMHDTESFWEKWEIRHEYPCTKDSYDWLNKAIDEFLFNNRDWVKLKVYENNNGLTILKRKNTPKVTVFTAIFWGYDYLKVQPEQTIDCKFVCFTDDKEKLKIERWAEEQREVIEVDTNPDLHPRMRAKRHRTHPYEYFKGTVMYMDGTARLKSEESVEFFVNQLEKWTDILCFQHPERSSITDEVWFTTKWGDSRWKKYRLLDLEGQLNHYLWHWFKDNIGLSATGLLIYKQTEKITDFLDKWYNENVKRTYQDQVSFEPTIDALKMNRKWIETEWDIRNNPYINFLEWHLRDD